MKKMKKVAALAMATAMAVSMAACGGSSATSTTSTEAGDTKADSGSYDQVVYAYATFNNIPSEEDLDVVEEEINKITREKIPLYLNRISALCVVKGILYKIVHSFQHPVTVAPKCNRL